MVAVQSKVQSGLFCGAVPTFWDHLGKASSLGGVRTKPNHTGPGEAMLCPCQPALDLCAQFPTLTPQAQPPQTRLGDEDHPPCHIPVPTLCLPRPGWPPLSSRLWGTCFDMDVPERTESERNPEKAIFQGSGSQLFLDGMLKEE